jgi:5-methylcytosine-specific restriction endonuclease McrA
VEPRLTRSSGLRARWKAAMARWSTWRRARRIAARNRNLASTCFYCGVRFVEVGRDHRTVDHRIPRSRGGTDGLSNLVFACYACNQRKRDRSEDEFTASAWLAARRADVASATRGHRRGRGASGFRAREIP